MRSKIALGVGALLLVGVAALGAHRWYEGHASTGVTAGAVDRAAAGRLLLPRALEQRTRYALTFKTEVLQGGGAFMTLALKGTLELTPRRSSDGELVLEAQYRGEFGFEQADVDGAPEAARQAIASGAARPFFAVYDGSGRLQELRFEPTVPRAAQTTLRSVMTAMQFVRPEGAAEMWQVEETDSNGRYLAQYNVEGSSVTSKQKLRYTEDYGTRATHRVVASEGRFEVSGGELQHLERSEEVLVTTSGLPLPSSDFRLKEKLSLSLRDRVAASPAGDFEARFARLEPLRDRDSGTRSARQAELDRAMAGNLRAQDALLMLHQVLEKGGKLEKEDRIKRDKALQALTALIRLDPETVPPLVEHIENKGPLTKYLIAALRDGGSSEAQTALRDLMAGGGLDEAGQVDVARALSLVSRPTPETTRALLALQEDPLVGVQASYGVGSNIHRLQESNPELAREAFGELQRRLQAADTSVEKQRYLTAIGASGHPDALAALQPHLASPDESIRAEAVGALRRVEGATADLLLADQLAKGSDRVRMEAADAIRERSHTPALDQALATALRDEQNPQVKNHLVQAANLWSQSPTVRASLEQLAENDPSESVRNSAGAVLDQSRKEGT